MKITWTKSTWFKDAMTLYPYFMNVALMIGLVGAVIQSGYVGLELTW
jgi:hypothetical protein